jgi:hypothetical protein
VMGPSGLHSLKSLDEIADGDLLQVRAFMSMM